MMINWHMDLLKLKCSFIVISIVFFKKKVLFLCGMSALENFSHIRTQKLSII